MLTHFLLSPLTLGLLIALVLWLVWSWLPRSLRYVCMAVELLLMIAMTPLGANLLVYAIESQVPPVSSCRAPAPAMVVVLSGGVDQPARSADDYSALTLSSVRRLFAAVALWKKNPDTRLVIAGGGERGTAESLVLASLAQQLGVSAAAISTETHSRTTWENAEYLAQETPSLPRRVWLVSSALHLPRAAAAFRSFGFEACEWSSGAIYIPPGGGIGYYLPQSSSLIKAELAIHELVGGLIYSELEWKLRKKAQRSTRVDVSR